MGLSAYDSAEVILKGSRVVVQMGSSWLRSQLPANYKPVETTQVVAPLSFGAVYDPAQNWRRLDGKKTLVDLSPKKLNLAELLESKKQKQGLENLVRQWLELKYPGFLTDNPDAGARGKSVRLAFFNALLEGPSHALIEDFLNTIRVFYANSHSEISATGLFATALLELAQQSVKRRSGATGELESRYIPVQVHQGALGACDRFARIMKQKIGDSNIPPVFLHPQSPTRAIWLEHGFEVHNLIFSSGGAVDWAAIQSVFPGRSVHIHLDDPSSRTMEGADLCRHHLKTLQESGYSISVISNQSIIQSGFQPDAVFNTNHLRPGGVGANGTLLVADKWVSDVPSVAGGGTVNAVTSVETVHYTEDATERENAGTPNLEAWIRSGLAAELAALVSVDYVATREAKVRRRLGDFATLAQRTRDHALSVQQILESEGIFSTISGNTLTITPHFSWSKHEITEHIISVIQASLDRRLITPGPRLNCGDAAKSIAELFTQPPGSGTAMILVKILAQVEPQDRMKALVYATLRTDFPSMLDKSGEIKPNHKSELLGLFFGKASHLPSPVSGISEPFQVYTDNPASGKAHSVAEHVLSRLVPLLHSPRLKALLDEAVVNAILSAHCADPSKYRYVDVPNGSTGAIDLAARMTLNLKASRGHSRLPGVVFVSEYEHHSNILIWRERGFRVEIIPLDEDLKMDWKALQAKLDQYPATHNFRVVSLSAASNVIGTKTDFAPLASIKHRNSDLVVGVDLAAFGPHEQFTFDTYPSIDMAYRSDHKLPAGPGSNGGLIFNTETIDPRHIPTVFTLPQHNTLALLKSGVAHTLQTHVLGWDWLREREHQNQVAFFNAIAQHNQNLRPKDYKIEVYGSPDPKDRTAITVFNLVNPRTGKRLHQHLVAQILNDFFGIQVRSGCNCAGPLGVRLLYGPDSATKRKTEIDTVLHVMSGAGAIKPGWVRTDVGLLDDSERAYLFDAIAYIATHAEQFLNIYRLKRTEDVFRRVIAWGSTWELRSGEKVNFTHMLKSAIFGNRDDVGTAKYTAFLKTRVSEVDRFFSGGGRFSGMANAKQERKQDLDLLRSELTRKASERRRPSRLQKAVMGTRMADTLRFFAV